MLSAKQEHSRSLYEDKGFIWKLTDWPLCGGHCDHKATELEWKDSTWGTNVLYTRGFNPNSTFIKHIEINHVEHETNFYLCLHILNINVHLNVLSLRVIVSIHACTLLPVHKYLHELIWNLRVLVWFSPNSFSCLQIFIRSPVWMHCYVCIYTFADLFALLSSSAFINAIGSIGLVK